MILLWLARLFDRVSGACARRATALYRVHFRRQARAAQRELAQRGLDRSRLDAVAIDDLIATSKATKVRP